MTTIGIGLTPRMRRLHRVLTDTPTLAYDLAQAAEVDNRAAGAVLAALERRGMAGCQRHRLPYRWYRAELPEEPAETWGLVVEEPGTGSQCVPNFAKHVT